MEKAIKWLKGTCNYNLFKSYMQDIEVAIKMAAQEAKQEVFDDINNCGIEGVPLFHKDCNCEWCKLKRKHLKKA